MSDPLDLDALAEVARKATPGPWKFNDTSDARGRKGEFRASSPHGGFMLVEPWTNKHDPKFIATFDPPTVLALIARVRAAEAALQRAESTVADLAWLREQDLPKRRHDMTATNAELIAATIRRVDGNHTMGAGELAEHIAAALASTPDQNEAREAWENYAKSEGLVYDMPNSSERRAFMAGWRPPLSTPEASDDERTALRDGFAEALNEVAYTCGRVWEAWQYGTMTQDDFSPAWEDEELLDSLVDAALARRSPVPAGTPTIACAVNHGGEPCPGYPHPTQADTPSEGDFPCCDDGEHVPAEIAGDLFTATLNRAQWHRVDEALAAHGRNDAVWSQIAATKTAHHPTPPELEREGDAASRVATPPEDVAAQAIRDAADAWHAEHKGTKPLVYSWLWNYAAALAAVPADGGTE